MKAKIKIIAISFFMYAHSGAKNVTEPYDYPIKPGMQEKEKEFVL